mgnify:CR=1 FL=1
MTPAGGGVTQPVPRDFFKKLVVDAVTMLDDDLNEKMIGMKRISGGSMTDTQLINGVAFKKTFSYAGFEQQPKVRRGQLGSVYIRGRRRSCRVVPCPPCGRATPSRVRAALREPQDLVPEHRARAQGGARQRRSPVRNTPAPLARGSVRSGANPMPVGIPLWPRPSVDNVADYQAVVDAEWQIIYQKLEKIVATGAKVVLSRVRCPLLASPAPASRVLTARSRYWLGLRRPRACASWPSATWPRSTLPTATFSARAAFRTRTCSAPSRPLAAPCRRR